MIENIIKVGEQYNYLTIINEIVSDRRGNKYF